MLPTPLPSWAISNPSHCSGWRSAPTTTSTCARRLPWPLDGLEISAKVLSHPRGPRIDVLRYKSKKRVRVHRGARADLTAIEILPFGGKRSSGAAKDTKEADEAEMKAEAEGKPKRAARKPRATKAKDN